MRGRNYRSAPAGAWVTFRRGNVDSGHGGSATLNLSSNPIAVRYLRIWMTESSNTCDDHGSSDRRNCVGFAIREIYLGTMSAAGKFYDLVRHTADPDQTTTYCSSVDPWHESHDVNDKRDQVGFDLFYTSGYTRGLPAVLPVALIYGTPEDSANQNGALYLQWATALHKVDPALKLGGPVFQGVNHDIQVWPDAQGQTSWLGRFIAYLKAHNRLQDLAFVSFEHYPLEPCKIQWSSLYDEPKLISHILDVWRDDGVPPRVPMLITELNIAWNTGESFVDTFGALWLADFAGAFFTAGGDGLYYFHYLPMGVYSGCGSSLGTFGMFTVDSNYQIKQYTSQFFASQLITQEWAQPGNGTHKVFSATSDITEPAGHVLVTAYSLLRPDGQWALMLINKDQMNSHEAQIVFQNGSAAQHFSGPIDRITFGSEQYQWHPSQLPTGGSADPDGPASKSRITAGAGTIYTLPKASITVLRGKTADLIPHMTE